MPGIIGSREGKRHVSAGVCATNTRICKHTDYQCRQSACDDNMKTEQTLLHHQKPCGMPDGGNDGAIEVGPPWRVAYRCETDGCDRCEESILKKFA